MLDSSITDLMDNDLFKSDLELLPEEGWVMGVDEVGRGPLAGPLMACAVGISRPGFAMLESDGIFLGATDSKKLKEAQRIAIYAAMDALIAPGSGVQYGLGSASVEEIDRINILEATKLAMYRALVGLEGRITNKLLRSEDDQALPLFESTESPKTRLLIDGKPLRNFPFVHSGVIKGDQKHLCIALASIIAKVERDAWMVDAAGEYDPYLWRKNKGYGTKAHIAAIRRIGLHQFHRKKFVRGITSTHSETDSNG
jgi:ribonuclease HII